MRPRRVVSVVNRNHPFEYLTRDNWAMRVRTCTQPKPADQQGWKRIAYVWNRIQIQVVLFGFE
jgi:hypothetical protein